MWSEQITKDSPELNSYLDVLKTEQSYSEYTIEKLNKFIDGGAMLYVYDDGVGKLVLGVQPTTSNIGKVYILKTTIIKSVRIHNFVPYGTYDPVQFFKIGLQKLREIADTLNISSFNISVPKKVSSQAFADFTNARKLAWEIVEEIDEGNAILSIANRSNPNVQKDNTFNDNSIVTAVTGVK